MNCFSRLLKKLNHQFNPLSQNKNNQKNDNLKENYRVVYWSHCSKVRVNLDNDVIVKGF